METLTCTPGCNTDLGHTLDCPRHTETYARVDARAKKRAQVDAAIAGLDGSGSGASSTPAPAVAGLLPAKPGRDERRERIALRFYERALDVPGTVHSRGLAAECADNARVFLDELDRNP